MCIEYLKNFKLNKYGYKVMIKADNNRYRNLYRNGTFVLDKWYIDKNKLRLFLHLEAGDYRSGYHIFNSLKDAKIYYEYYQRFNNHIKSHKEHTIIKVKYGNVVAKGIEIVERTIHKYGLRLPTTVLPSVEATSMITQHILLKVVVARKMKILKEIQYNG